MKNKQKRGQREKVTREVFATLLQFLSLQISFITCHALDSPPYVREGAAEGDIRAVDDLPLSLGDALNTWLRSFQTAVSFRGFFCG